MELGLSLGDKPCKKFHRITGKLASDGYTKTEAATPTSQDDDQTTSEDEEASREIPRIKSINDGRQKVLELNPPLQLDLLPPTLINRHVTEEATSSLRLDLYRTANVLSNKGLKLRSVAVEMERGTSRASDEDDNGVYRKKLRLTKQESAYLEESFKDHSILNHKQKLELAKHLNLSPRQVEVWFQNRRARTKLKQTEVDYEYLKRSCETLTAENRRLHKELQELRALKTTLNPLNLQLPPTTLTMCPSCERVAATTITPNSAPPNTKIQESILMSTTPFELSLDTRPFSDNSSH